MSGRITPQSIPNQIPSPKALSSVPMREHSDWRERAACWGTSSIVDFITPTMDDRPLAYLLCRNCPVIVECRASVEALAIGNRVGIFGGRVWGRGRVVSATDQVGTKHGVPLGACKHVQHRGGAQSCERCWSLRFGYCLDCEQRSYKRGRCLTCLRAVKAKESRAWWAAQKARGRIPKPLSEEQRRRRREASRRWRARQKARGIIPKPLSEEQRLRKREASRRWRAAQKARQNA